jgi:GNAT superfamily N-acetyltransferase
MSAGEIEELREMAANRGLRLVTSRRRTPGKCDYGRYGLKDAKTGRAVLGIGAKGLTAAPEEIIAFLRGGGASPWKSSLGAAGKGSPRHAPAKSVAPPSKPPRLPKPPKIRAAKPDDADALAGLIAALGYDVDAADVRKRLAALRKRGEEALVIEQGEILGLLTTSTAITLHRPLLVGRISMMVVAEPARGQGLGARLVAAAEEVLKARGCGMIEVTSNRKRLRAHAFYEKLGYERTSHRFAKALV